MPRYDYKCAWCEETVEITHLISDEPTIYCPKCVKVMTKGISIPAVSFNGPGFYSTDK